MNEKDEVSVLPEPLSSVWGVQTEKKIRANEGPEKRQTENRTKSSHAGSPGRPAGEVTFETLIVRRIWP